MLLVETGDLKWVKKVVQFFIFHIKEYKWKCFELSILDPRTKKEILVSLKCTNISIITCCQ